MNIHTKNIFFAGRLSLRSVKILNVFTPSDEYCKVKQNDNFILLKTPGFKNYIEQPEKDNYIIIIGQLYSDKEKIFNLIQNNSYEAIEGNFSIIEYSENGNLKITNDKFGTRPLFYYYDEGQLIFSNHISGIFLLSSRNNFAFSTNALIHFYHFGFTANDSTLFEDIKKIPPGHSLSFTGNKIELKKYFDVLSYFPSGNQSPDNEEYYEKEINVSLEKSLKARIPSDGRVALGLSGGVDSGFIAKKLVEAGADVTGINLSYKGFYDEHSRINGLSKKNSLKLNKLIASIDDLISSFEESNRLGSEPVRFNDAAMRLVALKAKEEGFESLWDGDGADRLFFGMNRTMLYNRVFKYYSLSKKFGLNKIFSMLTGFLHRNEMKKLHSLLKNWNIGIPPYPERKLDDVKWNKETEKEIFNIGVSRYYVEYNEVFKKYDLINYFTYQSVMMCPEMFFHPPYELQKSIGLYSVSPYWDTEVVRTALSIPASLKIKKGITKYILRKAAAFNDDKEYWMLPKIGLQNAYNYLLTDEKGKKWESEVLNEISKSDFIESLKDHLHSDKIDLKRLIPLYFWKNNLEK